MAINISNANKIPETKRWTDLKDSKRCRRKSVWKRKKKEETIILFSGFTLFCSSWVLFLDLISAVSLFVPRKTGRKREGKVPGRCAHGSLRSRKCICFYYFWTRRKWRRKWQRKTAAVKIKTNTANSTKQPWPLINFNIHHYIFAFQFL